MTILEALVQLRDDIKLWCINNFNHKLNKNLGAEESGKYLAVDANGDIIATSIDTSTNHTHSNKSVLDGITSAKVTSWNSASSHASLDHAPAEAEENVIEIIKVNGTTQTISNKIVDITVPTDTDTHYESKNTIGAKDSTTNGSATNGNVYLKHIENGVITSQHKIIGDGNTTVTCDGSGHIKISSTCDVFDKTLGWVQLNSTITATFTQKPKLMSFALLDSSSETQIIASGAIPSTLFNRATTASWLLRCPVNTSDGNEITILLTYDPGNKTLSALPKVIPEFYKEKDIEFEVMGI